MYTLKINYVNDKEKYYCKPYKSINTYSYNRECALKFKSIASAKRSFTLFYKKYYHLRNKIKGYDIQIIDNFYNKNKKDTI